MAGETFQLRFANNENVIVSIDEPINFATVDFQLKQKDKGYARDVSFNGGEIQFEFVKYRNHYLDKLLSYNNTYGFESIVELIISTEVIGELDFATAITDDFEYFKCKVIQQSSKQIVKRRKSVKVDLFSDKNVDGNYIAPLVPQNMVMISKPITENSRWRNNGFDYYTALDTGGDRQAFFNYCGELYDDSVPTSYGASNTGDADGTRILTAKNDLKNIELRISEVSVSLYLNNRGTNWWNGYSSGAGDLNGYFAYRYGLTFASAASTEYKFPNTSFDLRYSGSQKDYTLAETVNIASIPQGHSIWLYHYWDLHHSGGGVSEVKYKQTAMSLEIQASVSSVNSVVLSFSLYDVMRQVVKSISGLDIYAPRFDVGGDFYYNRLVNGNFLRQITEITEIIDDGVNVPHPMIVKRPFLISLEDLEKSLVELNCDWQITDYPITGGVETKIFFGTEDDFYTNVPMKVFPDVQFSSFNKTFNPRFQINEFNYGYKKFQSQKENEIINSYDVVNGESKWVLKNKNVENKKDISIEWIRDSFLIEESRRKAIDLTSTTSSQDDDTLFIIDSETTIEEIKTSSISVYHKYDGNTETLNLRSINVNLALLPLTVGDIFNITSSLNNGKYFIKSITKTSEVTPTESITYIRLERVTDNSVVPSISTGYSFVDFKNTTTNTTVNGTQVASTFSHYFTSTGIAPLGVRKLRITRTTAFPTIATPTVGAVVTITSSYNAGVYEVIDYSNSGTYYMDLKRKSDLSESGLTSTTYQYSLNPIINPYTSYTNNGMTIESGSIIDGDAFSNLRYSIKRNIHNYWRKYLSTCNLYSRILPISLSSYKNNKGFTATYNSIKLKEGNDIATAFIDTTPTLSPFIYNDVVFANVEYSDYIALQNNVRSTRGYITTYDNNGLEIKLYPIDMKYENLSKELTIKAEEKFNSTFVPTIQTKSVSPKSGTTELSGGNLLSDGYSAITAKGVVWDTSSNPTIALSTKTNEGTGYAPFTSLMSPLVQFTNYYAKSYATNAKGTSYGQEINFLGGVTDIQIGNQIWMVENLDVVKYRNGDTIPQVTDPTAWAALTTGAWCWYANSSANGLVYGKLYNWYAINDSRGLSPLGYYVPTDTEFTVLTSRLGGENVAGGKIKSTGDLTTGDGLWTNPNTGATNESGFTALPSGERYSGSFFEIGSLATWWTSTSVNTLFANRVKVQNSSIDMGFPTTRTKDVGMSVRLLKEYVVIGTQKWTNRNLNVSTYRNGVTIPQVTDLTTWAGLTTGAWCYYNNDPTTEATYGKLYNWYAVNDSRGLAPLGYHVPSDTEWTTLITYLGGELVAGGKMKETGISHWISPNAEGTNESAFTGLPSGQRQSPGAFIGITSDCSWWSSSEYDATTAWSYALSYSGGFVDRYAYEKPSGFSIRLIKE
jgi:uncharacterized protein (TIGR02145 family)